MLTALNIMIRYRYGWVGNVACMEVAAISVLSTLLQFMAA